MVVLWKNKTQTCFWLEWWQYVKVKHYSSNAHFYSENVVVAQYGRAPVVNLRRHKFNAYLLHSHYNLLPIT